MINNLKDSEIIAYDADNNFTPQPLVKEKDEEIVPLPEQWDDPTAWPLWRKWSIVICVALMYMLANFGTIIIVPGVPLILSEFNESGKLYQPLIVSIWELGEGVGSFLVGPLSERYGRKIIYHIGNAIFILCSVASALSVNVSMLVAFRFINGMAVTVLTLSPSIIGDLFVREERGTAMAVAISVPLIGPCVAPIVGGYVASALGWRWAIWLIAIAVGCVSMFSLLVFKETYKSKIQEKQSRRNPNSGPDSPPAQEIARNESPQETKLQSFLRPVRLLFSSPVVLVTSLFTSLIYGFSYLILTTLAEIMQETYGFGSGPVGLTFLGRAIGNLIGLALYGLTSDRYLEYRRRKAGNSIPEDRLPLMILGTALLPVGLFLYGWSAHFHVQWSVPLIGTGIVGLSMLLTKLPTDNYLVDAFAPQGTSASILSADATLKALFGAIFPLLGPSLYRNLGLGWGNSLLAFIGLVFLPLFIILWREGQELRTEGWGYLNVMMKRR
ncbi:bicyclomycin resistance protein, putative [Talaromyces stipitatus ATCC 10500]|uniref:Bicyclomycin resistance protein, putative n=1 Tax=Talaromyces stipitatus (strain ATCC 10500 / CBS 375.48 / QM 6759 / NRRL 1006) TaxID=441959 RepID=B8M5U2_TALSN|nr:bicyclomycin resistance protein, putative [Talaromyces stipitatus ATCC 10500]EED20069.1 bicyclomycin resistance protein, putative [Talaromyces stipitatus ATCC 10500]